jgi:uroporphyrin-III C-methyltransferase
VIHSVFESEEEIEYAITPHLETAIVPGISSALGAQANGISLTQIYSESFWLITGTKT